MASQPLPIPTGLHPIPTHLLDLRPDTDIDHALLHPPPISSNKNIWFFWHTGFHSMYPYTQRTVRAYHRRLSPRGWVILVLDRQPSSTLNIANFLDTSDPATFPSAFTNGTIGGDHAPQHTSDLVRLPLLLRYGGVYADVGMMQIGDLDGLWEGTVGDEGSRFEVLAYDAGEGTGRGVANYFLGARCGNAFLGRCQRLLLRLWEESGGRTSTNGMHASPLLKNLPLMGEGQFTIEEEGRTIGPEEVSKILTDYIIQGQAMTMVMSTVDDEDDWDGPKYVAEHVYCIEFMAGAQLINEMTAWDGRKAFELMLLSLPKEGEMESAEQKQAREIVVACLQRSFGFKLAHGLIVRVMGETLGSLWRENEGSDFVEGTYAHWLRYGMVYWNQDAIPPPLVFEPAEPLKRGSLLRE